MNDDRTADEYTELSYTPDFLSFDEPELEAFKQSATYQEAAKILMRSLNRMVSFIHDRGYSKSPTLWGVIFALGHPLTAGRSMTDVARELQCTKACISKIATDFIDGTGLPPSHAMKSEEARNTYRKTNTNKYGHRKTQ